MKQTEMKQIFNEVYKGNKNFMTPTIERYEQIGNMFIVEVSSGTGIPLMSERIYGITLLASSKGKWIKQDTFNRMLKSEEEVKQYISFLNNNVNIVESLSIPECLMIIETVEVATSLNEIEKDIQDILNGIEDLPHIDSNT